MKSVASHTRDGLLDHLWKNGVPAITYTKKPLPAFPLVGYGMDTEIDFPNAWEFCNNNPILPVDTRYELEHIDHISEIIIDFFS